MRKSLSKKAKKVIEGGVEEMLWLAAIDGVDEDRSEDDVAVGHGGGSDNIP